MKKSELEEMIRIEALNIIKRELPKIIKPMVQEAVAGALGAILAEGIVKGPQQSKSIVNNSSTAKAIQPASFNRRSLANQYESMLDDKFNPNDPVGSILSETAHQMARPESATPSVLDAVSELEGGPADEMANVMTRDYSELVRAMDKRRK
jgi:hypothetical protein